MTNPVAKNELGDSNPNSGHDNRMLIMHRNCDIDAPGCTMSAATLHGLGRAIFEAFEIALGEELTQFCAVDDEMDQSRFELKEAIGAAIDEYQNLVQIIRT